jgi:hypothetical protein
MEAFVKAVLYAYPTLGELIDRYGVHIKNKAILSALDMRPAERTAEYIAEEIARKRRLEWLFGCIQRAFAKLTEVERKLLERRFFKRRKSESTDVGQSERTYFRLQNRAGRKLQRLLVGEGVTREVFEREFAPQEFFKRVYEFVKKERRQVAADTTGRRADTP